MTSEINMHQEDLDLDRFIDMMDVAVNSDDPRIKRCLNNLMIMLALVQSHDDGIGLQKAGPFRKMSNDQKRMQQDLNSLRHELNQIKSALSRPVYQPDTDKFRWNQEHELEKYKLGATTGLPQISALDISQLTMAGISGIHPLTQTTSTTGVK